MWQDFPQNLAPKMTFINISPEQMTRTKNFNKKVLSPKIFLTIPGNESNLWFNFTSTNEGGKKSSLVRQVHTELVMD